MRLGAMRVRPEEGRSRRTHTRTLTHTFSCMSCPQHTQLLTGDTRAVMSSSFDHATTVSLVLGRSFTPSPR